MRSSTRGVAHALRHVVTDSADLGAGCRSTRHWSTASSLRASCRPASRSTSWQKFRVPRQMGVRAGAQEESREEGTHVVVSVPESC